MRYLGIDFGTKRVGTALSDESGSMAFPHAVFPNTVELHTQIAEMIAQEKVDEIVIGSSVNADGVDNPVQKAITDFVERITLDTGLPVHLEPEQYTTQEALRTQGRTDKTDASAAAIILNSYLTKQAKDA